MDGRGRPSPHELGGSCPPVLPPSLVYNHEFWLSAWSHPPETGKPRLYRWSYLNYDSNSSKCRANPEDHSRRNARVYLCLDGDHTHSRRDRLQPRPWRASGWRSGQYWRPNRDRARGAAGSQGDDPAAVSYGWTAGQHVVAIFCPSGGRA